MKFFRNVVSTLAILSVLPSVAFAAAGTGGQAFTNADSSLGSFATSTGIQGVTSDPATLVGSIVNTGLGILGLVALGLILYAGGIWLTAAGNEERVEKAKKIIKTTVIGIVVVGLAYAITAFIISLVVSSS